jgi:hypothetical protein
VLSVSAMLASAHTCVTEKSLGACISVELGYAEL